MRKLLLLSALLGSLVACTTADVGMVLTELAKASCVAQAGANVATDSLIALGDLANANQAAKLSADFGIGCKW